MIDHRLHRWVLLLLALFAGVLPAQKRKDVEMRFVSPDRYERATVKDEAGLLQWAEYKPEPCVVCKGKKTTTCLTCIRVDKVESCVECGGKTEAPCRSCGGLGHWPDPLQQVTCPGCMSAGCIPCALCGGTGKIKVEGGGERWTNCSGCRGDGGWTCGVCGGKRLVEAAAVKPNVAEADLEALQKAKAQVDELLKAIEAFVPDNKQSRKWSKQLEKLMPSSVTSVLPPLKKWPKDFEDHWRKLQGGNQFVGHGEREAELLKMMLGSLRYYAQHQDRLLALCIARAEHNEKLQADKKED